jgi:hypothetical protein
VEWGRLRDEITGASVRFGDVLRAAPAATTIVPPTSWSVAELGAHLVSLPRRYARMLDDDQAAFPERVSALNQAEIEAIGPRDPKQLADLLEADTDELLNLLATTGTAPCCSMACSPPPSVSAALCSASCSCTGVTSHGCWRRRGNCAQSRRLPPPTVCCHGLPTSSIRRSPSVPQARITFAYEAAMTGRSAYVTVAQ